MMIDLASRLAAAYRRLMADIDMNPGFDTLAWTQTLKAAGVDGKQAEALAAAARDSQAGLATKAHLDALRAELRADNAALRADHATLRADMRSDLYRALWIQTGAIVGPVVTVVKFM